MVEALCGVDLEERDRIREEQASRPRFQENETQEWTKGLTLEQTYLFKGGDMPEEGLVLQVYSNGQASLMGSPPMQATITQGNITLSPPEGLLLAWARLYCSLMSRKELSRSWSTARWKIKAPIRDQRRDHGSGPCGDEQCGRGCGQCPGTGHALFQSNETHWSGI